MMAIGFYGTFRDKLPYNQERILSYYFVAGDAFWRPNKSFSCSSFVLEGGMISGKCIEQGVRVMGMVWEEILVVCQASASVDVDLTSLSSMNVLSQPWLMRYVLCFYCNEFSS